MGVRPLVKNSSILILFLVRYHCKSFQVDAFGNPLSFPAPQVDKLITKVSVPR